MRKINILKALVDYLWIIVVPIGTLVVLFFVPALFFIDFGETELNFLHVNLITEDFISKLFVALLALNYLPLFYSLHVFKNTLRYFKNVKLFDEYVISSFSKIGNSLVLSGVVFLILNTTYMIYFESRIQVNFGFNTDLVTLGLGLFFQILSEVFKIAKEAKEENQLTI